MSDELVSLNIGKDVINPIIQEKVKGAIIEAMGGRDEVIDKMVNAIINSSVDSSGRPSASSYDRDRKYLDFVVTSKIQEAVQNEIKEQIIASAAPIKDAIIKSLRTKKGASVVANALLSGMENSFQGNFRSSVSVKIEPVNND